MKYRLRPRLSRSSKTWLLCLLLGSWTVPATALAGGAGGEPCLGCCDSWRGWRDTFQPPAADAGGFDGFRRTLLQQDDLYNGLIWGASAGAVHLFADPPDDPRWSDTNGFDRDLRDAFRSGSANNREMAGDISDALLATTIIVPLLVDSIGNTWLRNGDCNQAFDMATDWLESFALTALITQATKVISGRERPYGRECGLYAPSDANCGGDSRRESFFSGHASLAATGAGLICANSIKRRTWGDGLVGRSLPCALGVGAALATGMLRMVGDKHWSTDVLVGWAVGGLIGFFDVPGPVDLLRIGFKDRSGRVRAEGLILPLVSADRVGLAVTMRF